VTEFETVAPLLGDIMEAEMPVALTDRTTGIVCGEFEAAGSAIVAVAL
jgi:hypothetical protein